MILSGIIAVILMGLMMLVYYTASTHVDRKTYLYKNHKYMYISKCLMKDAVTRKWVNAIVYADYYNSEKLYIREETDFLAKFISLKQWREQNKKCKFVDKSK